MLNNLTDAFTALAARLGRQAKITEENIQDTVREIRMTLLEADVALPVVKELTSRIREQAIGQVVPDRLTPGQTFVKILLSELTAVLGGESSPISLQRTRPIVILLAGLQGAGKTTTAAKLGLWLHNQKQRVLLCSCDIYRPAAVDQLRDLCEAVQLDFHPNQSDQPATIASQAVRAARLGQYDVCLIDTAGRTGVDEKMMEEIAAIHRATEPAETLLVVDAMTGQDAANTARAFAETITVTGVVLAKADSDARGGAALSIATLAQCPVRFLGIGEKTQALEVFRADRMAKRILGMGDMLGAIEQLEAQADHAEATRLQKKLRGKGRYSLIDYQQQLAQMQKIGGIGGLLNKIGGAAGKFDPEVMQSIAHRQTGLHSTLIDSMTPAERLNPDIINPSRKRRIAKGAGMAPIEVTRLLKYFKKMNKMMVKASAGGGMKQLMQQVQNFRGHP